MSEISDAEKQLEDAIKNMLMAKGYADGLVVDWIVVTAQHVTLSPDQDPEGVGATATALFGPETQPTYRADGLVHYARSVIERKYRN